MSDRQHDNPLLTVRLPIPFDQIRAEHIEPAVRTLLEESQARMQAIIDEPGPRTFQNTLIPYDEMTATLAHAMTIASNLESVATTPEIRKAYGTVKPEVSKFYSSITFNPGLWSALKAYGETAEARALTGAKRRYLDKTLAGFRREGADLPPEKKARLSETDVELSKLTLKFSQNVVDATDGYELIVTDAARLKGLPESAVRAAREGAESRGKPGYRFTLQAPSYIPVMTYASDRALREEIYRAFSARATTGERDNRPIIARVLELRRERAALLGFANFADLVLEERMAKTGAAAERFLQDLHRRTEGFFRRENEELQAFRREIEGADAPRIEPWDVGYYAEKLRAARYDFDEEALREYFPFDAVLVGLFETASRLYGLRIEPAEGVPVWHPTVRAYAMRDASGEHLATFYVDAFAREGKRDGAWMQGVVSAVPRDPWRGPHVAVLAANVTPPSADRPSLLTHRDVETMFHEFGHLLHHCLGRADLRGQSGTRVAWDFVELPSQVMENWCWEPEALGLFAKHFRTGEILPIALIDKLRAARTFRAANAMMTQLGYGTLDLALHVHYDPSRDGDAVEYARNVMQKFSPAPLPADHARIAGFTHLFASAVGYAAGYYSYKWAEVLDADAFTRFKREGLFSRTVGQQFRDKLLARGDAADPAELYRDFMGRDPDLSALLERSGLVESASA